MSAATGLTVRIGESGISTETRFGLTRQARSRGMASLLRFHPDSEYSLGGSGTNEYGRIKLADVRKALDNLTLEGSESERIYLQKGSNRFTSFRHFARFLDPEGRRTSRLDPQGTQVNWLDLKLTQKGDVSVRMPCGEMRRYKVRTLDRVLTRLGA